MPLYHVIVGEDCRSQSMDSCNTPCCCAYGMYKVLSFRLICDVTPPWLVLVPPMRRKKEDIPLAESDVIRHFRPMECLLFFFERQGNAPWVADFRIPLNNQLYYSSISGMRLLHRLYCIIA